MPRPPSLTSIAVPLSRPLSGLTVLELRPLTEADAKALAAFSQRAPGLGALRPIVAAMSGQPPDLIRKLSLRDFRNIAAALTEAMEIYLRAAAGIASTHGDLDG